MLGRGRNKGLCSTVAAHAPRDDGFASAALRNLQQRLRRIARTWFAFKGQSRRL